MSLLHKPGFNSNEAQYVMGAFRLVVGADGRVDADEDRLLGQLAQDWMGSPPLNHEDLSVADVLRGLSKMSPNQILWTLRQGFALANADGEFHETEARALRQLATTLGLDAGGTRGLLEWLGDLERLERRLLALLSPHPLDRLDEAQRRDVMLALAESPEIQDEMRTVGDSVALVKDLVRSLTPARFEELTGKSWPGTVAL